MLLDHGCIPALQISFEFEFLVLELSQLLNSTSPRFDPCVTTHAAIAPAWNARAHKFNPLDVPELHLAPKDIATTATVFVLFPALSREEDFVRASPIWGLGVVLKAQKLEVGPGCRRTEGAGRHFFELRQRDYFTQVLVLCFDLLQYLHLIGFVVGLLLCYVFFPFNSLVS